MKKKKFINKKSQMFKNLDKYINKKKNKFKNRKLS